jgi:peptidoglycan/xylan/chitin deacetylase (PgdA/CDA1 family)
MKKITSILVLFVCCFTSAMFSSSVIAAELGKGMIAFTFDDGLISQVQAVQLMDKYGISGTFYVNTAEGRIGGADNLSFDNLRDFNWKGNEIANHTVNHLHLLGLTDQEKLDEITGVRGDFRPNGLPDPTAFASPFGEYDESVINILKRIPMTSNRQAWADDMDDPYNTVAGFNQWNLKVVSVRNYMTTNDLKKMIKGAADGKTFLIFVMHNSVAKLTGDEYDIKLSTLNTVLAYANTLRSKGLLDVVTISNGVAKMNWIKSH